MKKLLSVILALCMMLTLAAAAEEASFVGTWYAIEMSNGTDTYDIAMLGLSIVLTVNEDGTFTMEMNGETTEGTWEGANFTAANPDGEPDTIVASMEDGLLHLTDEADGAKQIIIFSAEAPAAFEVAEPKADAVLEDYNGTYTAAYIKMGEQYLPAETAASFGLSLPAITIENGVITADDVDAQDFSIGTMLSLFLSQGMELKDGKLVYVSVVEGVEGSNAIELVLLQDGLVELKLISNEEEAFSLLYAPAAE